MGELAAAARRQLAEHGAAALSVRAVARELGLVSSAVYRYVASRDELLTLLIVEAYDALGEQVETAVAATVGRPGAERWCAAAHAIRRWGIEHPHEYALVYGSPVPGYAAPVDTIGPATRVTRALLTVVAESAAAPVDRASPTSSPPSTELAADLDGIRATLGIDLPDDVLVRAIVAWTQLFGMVSFELFGQTRNAITDHEELFDLAVRQMAAHIGIADARRPSVADRR